MNFTMITIKKNMSTLDRFIRFFLGLAMLYASIFEKETINSTLVLVILGVSGISFIIVAFIAQCPVYKIANISTIPKE